MAAAFGMESPVFPFTVFTDRRGEVVTLYVGELHQAQADLILSVVQQLNQDRLPLTEADTASRRVCARSPAPAIRNPAPEPGASDAGQPAPKHPS